MSSDQFSQSGDPAVGLFPTGLTTGMFRIHNTHVIMKRTTRVFMNGNSQAVRIPREFRLKCGTVTIEKTDSGLIIRDPSAIKKKVARFRKLRGSCPDFPEVQVNANADIRRDFE